MYTIQYFKEKFSAIPEDKWQKFRLGSGGVHCALGHCGVGFSDIGQYCETKESKALVDIFTRTIKGEEIQDSQYVSLINDGILYPFPELSNIGVTPKERILKVLDMAQEKEQMEANLQFVQNEQKEQLLVV